MATLRKIAKAIIPRLLIQKIRALNDALHRRLIYLFAPSRWTASLYYCLFSTRFGREHQALLQGRIRYLESLKAEPDKRMKSRVLLRRNIHRLEKGLIMQPRRSSFASAYIAETLAQFQFAVANPEQDQDELQWAHDVLDAYFSVVKDTPTIAKARKQWETSVGRGSSSNKKPYQYKELPRSTITREELKCLFTQRRSVRWFDSNRKVSGDVIEKAVELSSLAPSACNRLPYSYYYLDTPKRAQEIAALAGGTVGFSQNIQHLIVVVGDLSCYPLERDRHCIYIDASLATMQLMLAFETMGVSTCPINWPDDEGREQLMAERLGLEKFQRPVMLLAFGYADPQGGIPYSAKKSANLLLVKDSEYSAHS
ncbi:nitroreductase family protein [Pseudidiomarina insulisalsae]|uniref:Nitroreductase-like protein n=1 Tax=Pseudidiomarina insulisalsae TaxID=575789 RepID=A0A432YNX5_9GAMM|nr:nitroreductase family protein [Pseudidiomarina insulisalsae]RUO62608.1 nitroreductase-like protein [Pseudidiomarina insulisalsae]